MNEGYEMAAREERDRRAGENPDICIGKSVEESIVSIQAMKTAPGWLPPSGSTVIGSQEMVNAARAALKKAEG